MPPAVIDAHIHIQPWRMIEPGALRLIREKRPDADRIMALMYDPAAFVRYLDQEQIDQVVSINYVSEVMGFTEEVHPYASDFARASGGRVIPVGSVDPLRSRDPAGEVGRRVDQGFRGLKIHPPHQGCAANAYRTGNRILEAIYREAEQAGLVLIVHTGTSIFPGARNVYGDPIACDDVAVDFPKLKIVLAHGGRPLWMETAVFLVRRFSNVWLDVSSIPPGKLLDYFPRLEELKDKVLWGSDWPAPGVPGMRVNVERFLSLPLSEAARRKILFENARTLYGPGRV